MRAILGCVAFVGGAIAGVGFLIFGLALLSRYWHPHPDLAHFGVAATAVSLELSL